MTDGWRYVLTNRALREMGRIDQATRRRIFAALDQLVEDPRRGDVIKLEGVEGEWRLRVGDWRVRFTRDTPARTIVVTRVLPRGRAYRD